MVCFIESKAAIGADIIINIIIIIIISTRLVTRHVNRGETMNCRRGWSFLKITQPSRLLATIYCVCSV